MASLSDGLGNTGPEGLTFISQYLQDNKDKNFVKRILYKDSFPMLQNGKDKDGRESHSTHSMATGEADGRYFAYPTVVQKDKDSLIRLEDREAWDYAIKTREFIEFPSEEEAQWFSKNYKSVWGDEYR